MTSPRDEPSASVPAAEASPLEGFASLRYLQDEAIRVIGPATGRTYAFSGARPVQWVDVRDARMLGRAAIFRLG